VLADLQDRCAPGRAQTGVSPSMDAPGDASTFSERLGACGQVLSSIRPVGAAVRSRWPVWRPADRVQIAYASLKALRIQQVCPIPSR